MNRYELEENFRECELARYMLADLYEIAYKYSKGSILKIRVAMLKKNNPKMLKRIRNQYKANKMIDKILRDQSGE